MSSRLDILRDRAIAHLRSALTANDSDRTAHLHAAASAYVDARGYFITKEGDPDWTGRTYAYRQWVRSVIGGANIPTQERGTIQAAIRYHIGNILRDRLTPDELEAQGLRPESPRERSIEKREDAAATLSLLTGGAPLDSRASIVAAAEAFTRAVRRVNMSGLDYADRDEARTALLELAAEAVRRAE